MEKGDYLWNCVNEMFNEKGIALSYKGFGACPRLVEDENGLADRFQRAAFNEGISLYGVSYINYSHRDNDITEVLDRLCEAIRKI
jgi:hypothetical protein